MKIRIVACSKCNGKGTVTIHDPHSSFPGLEDCPQCHGSRTMEIVVPEPSDNLKKE